MINLSSEKMCFTTKETVQLLGINRGLLDSYRKKGLIKAIKMGRLYVYPKSEIESFVSRNLGNEITKNGLVVVEGANSGF